MSKAAENVAKDLSRLTGFYGRNKKDVSRIVVSKKQMDIIEKYAATCKKDRKTLGYGFADFMGELTFKGYTIVRHSE